MDELIRQVLGETTTTASIGGGFSVTPPVIVSFGGRGKKRRGSKFVKATESTSIIPGVAQDDQEVKDELEGNRSTPADDKRQEPTHEPLIPTKVALVAPDFTPDPNAPLSPTEVPQAQRSAVPAQPAPPAVSTAPPPNMSKDQVLAMLMDQTRSKSPTNEESADRIKPPAHASTSGNPIVESLAPDTGSAAAKAQLLLSSVGPNRPVPVTRSQSEAVRTFAAVVAQLS